MTKQELDKLWDKVTTFYKDIQKITETRAVFFRDHRITNPEDIEFDNEDKNVYLSVSKNCKLIMFQMNLKDNLKNGDISGWSYEDLLKDAHVVFTSLPKDQVLTHELI